MKKYSNNDMQKLLEQAKIQIRGRYLVGAGVFSLASAVVTNGAMAETFAIIGGISAGVGLAKCYKSKKWANENYKSDLFKNEMIMTQAQEEVNAEIKDILTFKKARK